MKTSLTIALATSFLSLGCQSASRASFATPEEAVRELVAAAEDEDAADVLLGDGGFDLLRSGDDVADRQDLEAVVALVHDGIAFEDVEEDRKVALLGNERWEFPIPLVKEAGAWRFDVETGREEILNRRVGRNELSTIATLRELIEAQREYAAEGRDGNPPAFASKILSSPARHDGLYWPVADGEVPSPLGPLVADAADEGYDTASAPMPYHGYYFRLLTGQGKNAPGGSRSYLDEQGRLTGGFAVVAWPATYDNSGVMTFQVNQRGIVFQKDLGKKTGTTVALMKVYDPDSSWTPTGD